MTPLQNLVDAFVLCWSLGHRDGDSITLAEVDQAEAALNGAVAFVTGGQFPWVTLAFEGNDVVVVSVRDPATP